ncbi:MAG: B12-binding domain-containing radical SAM protein [Magnetococcales bacterium]|nr:B12-binding domain-containing radical SAM protein [Magnetococcales bacterium]
MTAKRIVNKVTLISPPGKVYVYPDGTHSARKHCTPPLGLAYLAANLLAKGYDAEIIDILVEGYNNEVYREPFIIYGLSNTDVVEKIRGSNPDIIGISALYSMLISEIYELCHLLKENFPDKPIILGGHHPSGAPLDVMGRPYVDFVLTGEAELTLVQLMEALNGQRPLATVQGLYYKDSQGNIHNTMEHVTPAHAGNGWNHYHPGNSGIPMDLDALPEPAWHLLPLEDYWKVMVRLGGGNAIGKRYLIVLSSRGCPHVCNFCSSPLTSGHKGYRTRNIESVITEIRHHVETYGADEIQFVDDNFFVHKQRAKTLMRRLAEEFPDLFFHVTGGTEANAIDDEMIELMDKANFKRALISVESGDQELQQAMVDKKVKLHRLPQIIEKMHAKNIDVRLLFMIGFPGEKRSQIQKTLDLAKALGVYDVIFSLVTAFPGTRLYDECLENNLFLDGFSYNDLRLAKSAIRLPDTSPEELESLRRSAWREAFEKRMQQGDATGRVKAKMFSSIDDYEKGEFLITPPRRDGIISYAVGADNPMRG